MAEKVEMYKTSDGSLFLSEQDADAHQRMFDAKIKLLDGIPEGYALYLNGVQMPLIPGGVPVCPGHRVEVGEARRDVQLVTRHREITYTNVTPGTVHRLLVPARAVVQVGGDRPRAYCGPCMADIQAGETYRLQGGEKDTFQACI